MRFLKVTPYTSRIMHATRSLLTRKQCKGEPFAAWLLRLGFDQLQCRRNFRQHEPICAAFAAVEQIEFSCFHGDPCPNRRMDQTHCPCCRYNVLHIRSSFVYPKTPTQISPTRMENVSISASSHRMAEVGERDCASLQGPGTYLHADGSVQVGTYRQGVLEGEGARWSADGARVRG